VSSDLFERLTQERGGLSACLKEMAKESSLMRSASSKGKHAVSSFAVFMKHFESGGAKAVLDRACFEEWVATRKELPKHPEESFRRSITAHVCKASGRRAFPPDVEAKMLELLRQKKPWPMSASLGVNIGANGFRAEGFHESKRSAEPSRSEQLIRRRKRARNSTRSNFSEVGSSSEDEERKMGELSFRNPQHETPGLCITSVLDSWKQDQRLMREVLMAFGIEEGELQNPSRPLLEFLRTVFHGITPKYFRSFMSVGLDMTSPSIIFLLNGALEESFFKETCTREFLCPENQGKISFLKTSRPGVSNVGHVQFDRSRMVYISCDDIVKQFCGFSFTGRTLAEQHGSKLHLSLAVTWASPHLEEQGHVWTHFRVFHGVTGKLMILRAHWIIKDPENQRDVLDLFLQDVSHLYNLTDFEKPTLI